jgi:hypothetical protein
MRRDAVDRVRLAPPARLEPGVHHHELLAPGCQLVPGDRVVTALAWLERGVLDGSGLDRFLTDRQRTVPGVEIQDCAVVVTEVPKQPPQPLGAAERAVGDHEGRPADSGARRRCRELLGRR